MWWKFNKEKIMFFIILIKNSWWNTTKSNSLTWVKIFVRKSNDSSSDLNKDSSINDFCFDDSSSKSNNDSSSNGSSLDDSNFDFNSYQFEIVATMKMKHMNNHMIPCYIMIWIIIICTHMIRIFLLIKIIIQKDMTIQNF